MSHSDAIRVRAVPTHPPTVLLLALLGQVGLRVLGTEPSMPWQAQVLGAALIVGGIALSVAADRRFKLNHTPVRPSAEATSLVTGGVFRWSRNPMYLGMASILTGSALALSAPWALVVVPVFLLWIGRLIRWEEARLEAAFGDEYRRYRWRVRRWL